ncbi:uncharacterized protein LOC103507488 [Diaphorina citri]|uniref:Uncharacterized protein LOC103507488 n=1 Tax=Diaphorina citri TaxID=121845 RepID=A0A1S3CY56_DIACI|nr:uncharacterized protein LOC103507488 [Diaphorina citri]
MSEKPTPATAQGSAGSSGDRKDINPVLNKRSYGPQKYNRQEDRYQGERFHNNYKSHHGRGNSSDQYMPQGNSGNQFYNSRGNSRDRFNNPRGYSSDRFNSNKHNQRNSGDKYPRDHSLQPRPSTSEFSGVDSVYDIINDKNNQSNNNKQVMRERNEIHGDGKPNNKFQRDANKRDLESLKEKTTDGVAFIKQFNKPKKMRGQQHEKQMRGSSGHPKRPVGNGSNKFGGDRNRPKVNRYNSDVFINAVLPTQSHPELFSYEQLSQELLQEQQQPVSCEIEKAVKPVEKRKSSSKLMNGVKISNAKGQGNIPNEFKRRKKASRLTQLQRIRKGVPVNSDDDDDQDYVQVVNKKTREEKKKKIQEIIMNTRLSRDRTRKDCQLPKATDEVENVPPQCNTDIDRQVTSMANTDECKTVSPQSDVAKCIENDSSDESDFEFNSRNQRKSEAHKMSDNLASDLAKYLEKAEQTKCTEPKDLSLADLKGMLQARNGNTQACRRKSEDQEIESQMQRLNIHDIETEKDTGAEMKQNVAKLLEENVTKENSDRSMVIGHDGNVVATEGSSIINKLEELQVVPVEIHTVPNSEIVSKTCLMEEKSETNNDKDLEMAQEKQEVQKEGKDEIKNGGQTLGVSPLLVIFH